MKGYDMRPSISYADSPIDALNVIEQDSAVNKGATIPPTHYVSVSWNQGVKNQGVKNQGANDAPTKPVPSIEALPRLPTGEIAGAVVVTAGSVKRISISDRLTVVKERYSLAKALMAAHGKDQQVLSEGVLAGAAKTTCALAGGAMPPKHDRATRMAAAKKMVELWKDSGNGPTDGVEYQNRMRAEWQ